VFQTRSVDKDYISFYERYIEKIKLHSGGKQANGLCPFHEDKKSSFSVNLETGQWKCFSGCGEGNSLTFADRMEIPRNETPDWIERPDKPVESKGQSMKDTILQYAKNLSSEKRDYWSKRMISSQTLDKYKIGWNKGYYIFPYLDLKGNYIGYKAISEDKKQYWQPAGIGNPLFNSCDIEKAKKEGKTIVIAEGEKDTLVLKQEGYLAVGVSGVNGFKEEYKEFFRDIKDIVVCFDNDEAGIQGARKVASILGHKARVVQWGEEDPEKFDVNDLYVSLSDGNFKETFDKLLKEARPVTEPLIVPASSKVNDLMDYWNKTRDGSLLGLDTGFDKLNDKLSGLRGLTILGAAPKMGKSAFSLQMASNIAEKGMPVIYYDFENGEMRLYTRIICRLARLGETELRLTGIPADKFEDYKKAIEKFKILGNNLFVVTNRKIELTDIFQQIDYAREITDKKKILLVFDSLQKLPVKSLRDRRSGIDLWLRDLEEIRDRKEVEILLISEIKRDERGGSYRPLVDSFKESGDIEYTADTALGIYRPDAEDNTLVRLEVLAGRDVESGIVADYRVKYPFWEFEEINQRERNKRSGREEDL